MLKRTLFFVLCCADLHIHGHSDCFSPWLTCSCGLCLWAIVSGLLPSSCKYIQRFLYGQCRILQTVLCPWSGIENSFTYLRDIWRLVPVTLVVETLSVLVQYDFFILCRRLFHRFRWNNDFQNAFLYMVWLSLDFDILYRYAEHNFNHCPFSDEKTVNAPMTSNSIFEIFVVNNSGCCSSDVACL